VPSNDKKTENHHFFSKKMADVAIFLFNREKNGFIEMQTQEQKFFPE
jgi:hypothetical protein